LGRFIRCTSFLPTAKKEISNTSTNTNSTSNKNTILPPLLLLLDNVTDPHNVGACLRSANAAGVDVVLAPKDKSCKWNGTVEKVSSGAQTPYILVTNLSQTIEKLQKDYGFLVYGAAGESDVLNLYQQTFPKNQPIAWVLGSEGEGLRQLTRKRCDGLVKIPMRGQIESLNVSVATSLCIFETMRQWTI
jgi:23S rRNA (guanosine2251-2'-O)-methyltransferase